MLYQEFELPKYDWHVSVFYNSTFEDREDIMDCLYEMNCNSEIARKAYGNLSSGQKNTGLTFSKDNATCIVLGIATDSENFAHTYTHEIAHCAMHIAKEYGIDPQSEEYAYIVGDLGAKMFPYASKFMCDCCRKKVYHERTHGEDRGYGVSEYGRLTPYLE